MAGWSWPCGHPNWVRPQDPDQDPEQETGTPRAPHPDLPETPYFDARDAQGQFTEEG